jgi:elongation factor G
MDRFDSENIRNVALVGHTQCGKTTLCELLAVASGDISKAGSPQAGNTLSDFEPEEIQRHASLSTSLIALSYKKCKINLLDTPGDPDFEHEVIAGLSAAECAILCVSATDGIQIGTENCFDILVQMQIPVLFLITKLDKENTDYFATCKELANRFGNSLVPAGFYDDKINFYLDAESHDPKRNEFIEAVVSTDDEALEKYLGAQVFSKDELTAIFKKAFMERSIYPVLGLSQNSGHKDLLDFLIANAPNPLEGHSYFSKDLKDANELVAVAVKSISDQYSGRLTLLKILSGELLPDVNLLNCRTHKEERMHVLQTLKGKEHITVTNAKKGDIVGVAKLNDVRIQDVFVSKNQSVPEIKPLPLVAGICQVAIVPKEKGDDDKLMGALTKLSEEDPSLKVERIDETHQTILRGNGELHLKVTIERLKRRFQVEVLLDAVKIRYRETITGSGNAEGKYKKQTGGHGQFGVALINIKPLERGAGFKFYDEIVGGAIPRQYIPAVEKGIKEAMDQGVIWGYPVIDVEVHLTDGKYHPVDSSELSFKMAGAIAFREAFVKASPVLLEPISKVTVIAPSKYQGDLLADLNSKRGKVISSGSLGSGEISQIVALVPNSELANYSSELKALASGRAKATIDHDHYDIAPSFISDKIPKQNISES